MKKAKIMLASIAVIALVSGAFAFKAHKNPTALWYKFQSINENNFGCISPVLTAYTTDPDATQVVPYYTTSVQGVSEDFCTFTAVTIL